MKVITKRRRGDHVQFLQRFGKAGHLFQSSWYKFFYKSQFET